MAYEAAKPIFASLLEQIKSDGLYKEERVIESRQSGRILARTKDGTKELINLCANNYLGLSSHPELIQAAHDGLEQRGFGMSSVRFICGTQDIHIELEEKISSFLGMEATCLFASCFDANAALFETFLTAEDGIFSDRLVHASIVDGVRLSKAQRFIYQHSDLDDLKAKLSSSDCRIRLIITDGVFSMDGDMAKLDQLAEIAEQFSALLVVDDSHATGFIGETGKGTHEYFSVIDKVDIITTTFGKALGGATGGCISGKKEIIDLMKQRGRPYLFSNALMPAVVNATLKALDLLEQSSERREKLERLSLFWRTSLQESGFDIKPGNTPIIPIMLYDAKLAQAFSRDLLKEGILAVGFFYPVVPQGQARIRTQISAALEQTDLNHALNIFQKVGKKHSVI